VSSNDNQNRSYRQAPREQYDDEFLEDDAWDIDLSDAPPARSGTGTGRQPSVPRAKGNTPSMQGTAAQIERLRRNLGQGSRGNSVPPRPQTTQRRSPEVTYRQPATPADDMVVSDTTYDQQDTAWQPAAPAPSRSSGTPYRRTPATAPARQATNPPADYGDPYVDTYDDQYVDDQYLDYEDDFSEYDAPRRPGRAVRQRPQVKVPSISRPSLPPAIANADLVNDVPALGIIGVGVASLAAMAILVANRVDTLAPQFATHVSASGVLESIKSESFLWNLPLMAAMFTLMNIVMAWFISPIDRFASRFVLVGSLVVQFVAWVALIRLI